MNASLRSARGFTLLELILVVLIVGLLISLTMPGLARTRHAAQRTGSLANIRTHVMTMTAYCGDYADTFPYLTDPRATYSVLRCGDLAHRVEYFYLAFLWHFGLAGDYYNGDCGSRVFWPPRTRPGYATSYYYSANFIAAPEFWNPRTRTGPDQWRSTRQSQVLFPSLKGIIWNRAAFPGLTPEYPSGLPEVGFTDGSTQVRPIRDFLPPYRNGEGSFPGSYYGGYGLPVHHTIDGVRGRDLR